MDTCRLVILSLSHLVESHVTLITYQLHIVIIVWSCQSRLQATSHWEISLTRYFLFSRFPQRFPRLYRLKGVLPFDSGIFPEQTGNTRPRTGPASL